MADIAGLYPRMRPNRLDELDLKDAGGFAAQSMAGVNAKVNNSRSSLFQIMLAFEAIKEQTY